MSQSRFVAGQRRVDYRFRALGVELAVRRGVLMNFKHRPVMVDEVVRWIGQAKPSSLLDGTLGGGGHAEALLEALPNLRIVGIDRDPDARRAACRRLARFGERISISAGSYSAYASVLESLGLKRVDAMLLDIGVSSAQLDTAERGFSFRADAALDMRMDPSAGPTAAELIDTVSETALADILWRFGEERQSRRFARAIKRARPRSTGALARLIQRINRSPRARTHPATRTFQALRIAVNDELGELDRWLRSFTEHLGPRGVAVVISFHSLEDRRVKRRFRELALPEPVSKFFPHEHEKRIEFELPFRNALVANDTECQENPRARSAKLRVIQRSGSRG